MSTELQVTRRRFLGTGAAGALVLVFNLPAGRFAEAFAAGDTSGQALVDGWLIIEPDNSIIVRVASAEMGQGIYTSMPMLIAEELEVGLDQIQAEMAPVGPQFTNLAFNMQATGGSTSIRWSFMPLRQVGAQARELLRAAAAEKWQVPLAETRAVRAEIRHTASARRASYGELAARAAQLQAPEKIALKPRSDWKLLGKPMPRLDTVAKSTGRAGFGIDVQFDGLLLGTVTACPVFGGKLKSVDEAPALAVNGVKKVIRLEDAVVVLADGYWPAKKGLAALTPEWDYGANAGNNNAKISQMLHAGMDKTGAAALSRGDDTVLDQLSKTVSATYEVPILAHATMEPMNATANVTSEAVDVWLPTQAAGVIPGLVAKLTGVPAERVNVHTTFLGGGFGRRFEMDFVIQTVLASKIAGAPVKLIWSREEDMRHDFYRPPAVAHLRAGIDGRGRAVACRARICSPSIMSRVFPQFVKDGVDHTSVEGIEDSRYGFANFHVDYVREEVGLPVGFWRAVGHSQNAFFMESFIDELANEAGEDPVAFRLALLADQPRHVAALKRLAREAGWGQAPAGHVQGVALHESFGGIVGHVVDATVTGDTVKLHKFTSVVDCGIYLNPDTVRAQVDSSIAYGLTAAWYGDISVVDGAVQEGNFDTYRILRLAQMPRVETFIMENDEAPGGMGEPALPSVAPAVANAIYAATGKRYRSLPLGKHGLQLA